MQARGEIKQVILTLMPSDGERTTFYGNPVINLVIFIN